MLRFSIFKRYPKLIHGVFERKAGNVSLNLGSPEEVSKNLRHISQELDFSVTDLVRVNQVHSTRVVVIDTQKQKQSSQRKMVDADGLITNQKDTFLLIKTADCLPLFLFDPQNRVVGLVHLGWRGAVSKIHLHALLKMQSHFNSHLQDIIVGMGPSICGECYRSEQEPLQAKLPEWKKFIRKKSHSWTVDIPGFVKQSLTDVGILQKNIAVINQCTVENSSWFSHQRAEQSGEPDGRFASIIGLKK